ncbi:MAG: hypothetical protein PHG97_05305, partial [Candidatus Margulisbacteria bacterium]|nr:hypothetical protein [Candidatus Margulisiibacteriota bacterium]
PGRTEDIDSVSADLTALRLTERVQFLKKENSWSLEFALRGDVPAGTYVIPVQATNVIGGLAVNEGTITVYK